MKPVFIEWQRKWANVDDELNLLSTYYMWNIVGQVVLPSNFIEDEMKL